jgi:non-specific serine/threonine protein kinase
MNPALVPQALASVLDVRQRGSVSVLEALRGALASRTVLIVLDNCEHVVEQCATMLDALLRACPGMTVLATSREPLQIPAEMVWPVQPLSLPHSDVALTVKHLLESEAGELFVERARGVAPGFVPTQESVQGLAEICRRLDGLPLAIELAAVCVRTLSLDEIARRLGDRFTLLTHTRQVVTERHRAMWQAIAWSYDLLEVQDKFVFWRLAVFASGWTLDLAQKICTLDDPAIDIVSGVRRLVEKSLVEFDPRGRYRLLDSMREFAFEKLDESGEAAALRLRHAEVFLALAEESVKHLNGPALMSSVEQLETEQDNLRAAMQWCFHNGQRTLGLRIACELALFWSTRGHLSEGEHWLERGLQEGEETISDALRARALAHASALAAYRADTARAQILQERALALRQALGDKPGIGDSLTQLGAMAVAARNPTAARRLLEEALDCFQELGNKQMVALVACHLAIVTAQLGDYVRAAILGEQSLMLVEECGVTRWLPRACLSLGLILLRRGEDERSAELLRRAVLVARETGESWSVTLGLELYAHLAVGRGQPERAVVLLGGAAALHDHTEGASPLGIPNEVPATTTAARNRLGASRFRRALEHGRNSRLDDLIKVLQEPLEAEARTPDSGLTAREQEVVQLLARGYSNREIAAALVIAISTTERHVANILNRLNLRTRTEVALWATENGLVPEDGSTQPRMRRGNPGRRATGA